MSAEIMVRVSIIEKQKHIVQQYKDAPLKVSSQKLFFISTYCIPNFLKHFRTW